MTKKTPGPRAPPVSSRPSLKMTALSYSCKFGDISSSDEDQPTWTTFTTKKRDSGRVTMIRKRENIVRAKAQILALNYIIAVVVLWRSHFRALLVLEVLS